MYAVKIINPINITDFDFTRFFISLKSPMLATSLTLIFKEKYTVTPVKKTIAEDAAITYLNASCFSFIVESDMSPMTTREKIKTPIKPIDEATIPLPASKKLKVFPCFFSPPITVVALIIGAQKRKTVVKPQ